MYIHLQLELRKNIKKIPPGYFPLYRIRRPYLIEFNSRSEEALLWLIKRNRTSFQFQSSRLAHTHAHSDAVHLNEFMECIHSNLVTLSRLRHSLDSRPRPIPSRRVR